MFAFTAPSLISSLLGSFLLDLAQKAIIETIDINEHFLSGFVGQHSAVMARHSSLVYIQKAEKENAPPTSFKYVWSQKDMQPWGKPIPAQCPQCKGFRPWGNRKLEYQPDDSQQAKFYCRGQFKGSACNYAFVAPKPKNVIRTLADWMMVKWPADGPNTI
jgi:hypothetical protein